MPNTRHSSVQAAKKKVQSTEADRTAMASAKTDCTKRTKGSGKVKETAYEQLYNKLQTKRRKLQEEVDNLNTQLNLQRENTSPVAQESERVEPMANFIRKSQENVTTNFREDDNIVEMEVEGMNQEFLTSEDDETECEDSSNNNVTISNSVQGHLHSNRDKQAGLPDTHESEQSDEELKQSFIMLQSLLIKKGMMSEEEMSGLIQGGSPNQAKPAGKEKQVLQKGDAANKGKGKQTAKEQPSEVTVYRKAVKQIGVSGNEQTDMGNKIIEFISQIRQEGDGNRNVSTSSEEMMDTSDESDFIVGAEPEPGCSSDPAYGMEPRKTTEDFAEEIIKEGEKGKPQVYSLLGKSADTNLIDQDYQMIDAHVDETMRQKIIKFEFIELSKLLPRNKSEDNRMEIVSKNGSTYLSPVSDRDNVQINSYSKWEQAFRVYANVLTSRFPTKATELLQYNHTIQTASFSYYWDNVSAYDKEFRQHIARHPERSWSVILQQAWTMLLKDRICNSNHLFQKLKLQI